MVGSHLTITIVVHIATKRRLLWRRAGDPQRLHPHAELARKLAKRTLLSHDLLRHATQFTSTALFVPDHLAPELTTQYRDLRAQVDRPGKKTRPTQSSSKGGPGYPSRFGTFDSGCWMNRPLQDYRVVLLDQRGAVSPQTPFPSFRQRRKKTVTTCVTSAKTRSSTTPRPSVTGSPEKSRGQPRLPADSSPRPTSRLPQEVEV